MNIRDLHVGNDQEVVARVGLLSVSAGETVAVMGPSGSGKTTLLRTLAGEIPAVSGSFDCRRSEGGDAIVRTIQGAPLLHWRSVGQDLRLAANVRGDRDSDVSAILGQLGIGHLENVYPGRLSGGERVRAALAQALTGRPSAILLDEPFTQLDFLSKRQVADVLFCYVRHRGLAALFITHDIADAITYADRVAVLSGRGPAELRVLSQGKRELDVHEVERAMAI